MNARIDYSNTANNLLNLSNACLFIKGQNNENLFVSSINSLGTKNQSFTRGWLKFEFKTNKIGISMLPDIYTF